MAKIIRDGNLLMKCGNKEQRDKALHIESIRKKVMTERRVLGENKVSRGVITGIPIDEDLEKVKSII